MIQEAGVAKHQCCKGFAYYLSCCKCICFRNGCKRYMNSNIYQSSNDALFGELLQCKLILERNFDGAAFQIHSESEPDIDCMFFPASHGEKIVLDPDSTQ